MRAKPRYEIWPWWGFVLFIGAVLLVLTATGPVFTLFSLAAFVSWRLHTG